MQSSYRLPTPLPQLPVRKGVRGRRPKSETIALLKALAASSGAQSPGARMSPTLPESAPQLVPRPHKKRGPKPGSKVCRKGIPLLCGPACFIPFKPKQYHVLMVTEKLESAPSPNLPTAYID